MVLDFARIDKDIRGEISYEFLNVYQIDKNGARIPDILTSIPLTYQKRNNLLSEIQKIILTDNIRKLIQISEQLGRVFLSPHLDNINTLDGYLTIRSNDLEIPWHLLHVPEYSGDYGFVSLRFPFTFQPYTDVKMTKTRRTAKALIIIDPTRDPNLKFVKEEKDEIKKIFENNNVQVEVWPNENKKLVCPSDFVHVLEEGTFDFIHFIGHGDWDKENAWLCFYLERFYASELNHIVLRNSPFVFLNACYTGKVKSYSLINSIAAVQSFAPLVYKQGASAFIGAIAPLRDRPAKDFSVEFYKNFIVKNRSLGQSALSARRYIFEKYPNELTWATYLCYGEANTTIERRYMETKKVYTSQYLDSKIDKTIEFTTSVRVAVKHGLEWLIENKEIWIRDVHKAAEVIKLLSKVNPNIVEHEMPNYQLRWIKARLENLYESWLKTQRIKEKDIGFPSICRAMESCNSLPVFNFVDALLDYRIKKTVIETLIRREHEGLWYFAESEGMEGGSPRVSARILGLFMDNDKLVEELTGIEFRRYLSEHIRILLDCQHDGIWRSPRIKGLWPDESSYNVDTITEVHPVVVALKKSLQYLSPNHNTSKRVFSSLEKTKKAVSSMKEGYGGEYWWRSDAHCEERKGCSESDVKGTSLALEILLLCSVDPFAEEITGGINWLIKNRSRDLGWPIDTRLGKDVSSVASNRHAIHIMRLWLEKIFPEKSLLHI